MNGHLLTVGDLTPADIESLLSAAETMKSDRQAESDALRGKSMALLFEKPSLRTRLSFEVAMGQLGGRSYVLTPAEVGLGVRESIADVAQTLSELVDVIVGRVFDHAVLEQLATWASIPVVNGLSDREHPCQVLADLLTLRERFGSLTGRTLAYVGDGNNVACSLVRIAPMVGMNVCLASPPGYEPPASIASHTDHAAQDRGGWVEVCTDPRAAVRSADAIYADAWYSMGQEHEAALRRAHFQAYQVNTALLAHAPEHAVALHCLPAHRGDEITDEVLDGPRCLAFHQAANRVHVQKAVLLRLLRSSPAAA